MSAIRAAIAGMVTRGKVVLATVAERTKLQATALDNETFAAVELILPPGYSARPAAGADITLINVLGVRDHKIAIGGVTAPGDAISDLAVGEFGLRHGPSGAQLVFRTGGTVQLVAGTFTVAGTVDITGPVNITGNVAITGTLSVTGDITGGAGTGNAVGLRTHEHSGVQSGAGNSGPPVAGT